MQTQQTQKTQTQQTQIQQASNYLSIGNGIISLPTEKSKPAKSLFKLKTLIYGCPKIGKSTFCSQIPDALFLDTESGLEFLDVYKVKITKWEDIIQVVNLIAGTQHQFKTVVIDTVDNFYDYCTDFFCRQYGLANIADMKNNAGYGRVNSEIKRVLNAFSMLPYGVFLTAHTNTKEEKYPTQTIQKIIPSLSEKPRKIILGWADIILYADSEFVPIQNPQTGEITQEYRRVIRTVPSPYYDAGSRFALPPVLPLDFNAFREAFEQS